MRYSINFATRTYLDHRLLNRAGYVVIALLVLLAGWNVSRVSSVMGELSRLNDDIAAIQNKSGAKPGAPGEKELSSQKARIRFYNEIIDRKSTNWLNLLDVLENVTPGGVALTTVSPGKAMGELKLEGNARSFAAVRQYLEKLETSKYVSDVLLMSHKKLDAKENASGVQFMISCKVLFQ